MGNRTLLGNIQYINFHDALQRGYLSKSRSLCNGKSNACALKRVRRGGFFVDRQLSSSTCLKILKSFIENAQIFLNAPRCSVNIGFDRKHVVFALGQHQTRVYQGSRPASGLCTMKQHSTPRSGLSPR